MFERKPKEQTRGKRVLRMALCWLSVLAMLVGCNTVREQDQTPGLFDPFSATRDGGDGTEVTWNGYTRGYQPDDNVPLEITIQNETDDDWVGRFCVFIMDTTANEPITPLEVQEYRLSHNAGFSKSITLRLPDTLHDDVYSLVLVVERPNDTMADVIPIHVGDKATQAGTTPQYVIDIAIDLCQ